MAHLYLSSLLFPSFVVALLLWFWGLDQKKEYESAKAILSRVIYYLQFGVSLGALYFFEHAETLSFSLVKLTHYHYDLMFTVERYQIGLAILFSLLFILVEKLSYNYLHAEEEHAKFYGLKVFLNLATMLFIFSTNIDFLFFSWEIVGLSSALLISYFYRRNQAVQHSLFAFSVYRFCDAAFLFSALLLFYYYQTESILQVGSGLPATILGILFLIAISGKSGLYPFSSWLPLALEGPTPSSNLYYMTLSTHLGIIFLIKTSSLWEGSLVAKTAILVWATLNCILCSMSARVQTNIKGAIAYSTLAQVSVILIEVALGFYSFALFHTGLHIFYRFSQMTTAPSIIDHHNLIERLSLKRLTPRYAGRFYYLALQGFQAEVYVLKLFRLFMLPFAWVDHIENKLLHYRNSTQQQKRVLRVSKGWR